MLNRIKMKQQFLAASAIISLTAGSAFAGAGLPSDAKASLQSAFETDNAFVISAVSEKVKSNYPDLAEFVDAYLGQLEEAGEQAAAEAVAAVEPAAGKAEKDWSGKVEGGAAYETGNTDRESLNFAGELNYKWNEWENIAKAKAVSSKEDDTRTAEEYRLENQARYNFTEHDYAFVELGYVNDRFSGYNYRMDELVGYGRRIINEDDMTLNGEISAGARQTKLTTGDKEEGLLGKVKGDFDWTINDYLTFEQDAAVTVDEEVTIINTETGLKAKMSDKLYLKLGFELENISDVPAGREETDTRTTVSVGYDF